MSNKIKSIAIVDGDCPPCQVDTLTSASAKLFTFNKNPSNSSKTRTADNSACTGSLSIPPNNSGRTAPDAAPLAQFHPASLRFDFLQLAARSSSSAQHTSARPGAQVENRLPLPGLTPCATDPAHSNFFFSYS
jgi:hypothetical protein